MTYPHSELRAIPSWPGYYAGDDGSIWSARSGGDGRIVRLTPYRCPRGYPTVRMRDYESRRRGVRVHRLVCEAFHGPAGGPVVRHLDGDRENNSPRNLRWGTYAENAADRRRHEAERAYRESQVPEGWAPGDPDSMECANEVPF